MLPYALLSLVEGVHEVSLILKLSEYIYEYKIVAEHLVCSEDVCPEHPSSQIIVIRFIIGHLFGNKYLEPESNS